MQDLAGILEFIRSGGAMAVVLVVCYGLVSGRLRLAREIESCEAREAELKRQLEEYRDRLLPIAEKQQDLLERIQREAEAERNKP